MALASSLKVIVQVAVLPVIGRFLGPHAYGQIALVSPFIFFSMMIAESGLGACIVRAEKVTPALEGTVFCFTAGLSSLIIACFGAAAWPIGRLLHEPLFPPLLLAMSSILLLASLHIVPAALLLRDKHYDWIAASDVFACLGGVAGTVTGLALGWGVWSLIAQQVSFWVCKVVVVTLGARYRPRLIFHISLLREHAHFGANLTGGTLLSFIARNIDNILIGAFIGTEALGYYAMAFQITGLPQMVLSGSLYFILFSSTSEAHRQSKLDGTTSVGSEQFITILRGALLIAVPTLVGIAATAPLAVPLLLGDRWLPMVPLIWLLVPLGISQATGAAASGVLIGLGRSDTMFRITLISATATIVAILIGVQFNSAAVAIGVSLTALLGQVLSLHAIQQSCGGRARAFAAVFAPSLAASALMALGVILVERALPAAMPAPLALALSIAVGIALYGLALFTAFRRDFNAAMTLAQGLVRARLRKGLA